MCDNVKSAGVGRKLKSKKSLDFLEEMDKIKRMRAQTCNTTYKKSYEFSIKNGFIAYLRGIETHSCRRFKWYPSTFIAYLRGIETFLWFLQYMYPYHL